MEMWRWEVRSVDRVGLRDLRVFFLTLMVL